MTFALLFAIHLASAATPTDGLPLDAIATIQSACAAAEPTLDLQAQDDLEETDFTPASPAAKPQRGYCRCTCSLTPNCSTNADCGGGLCLKGPTCC